MAGAAGAAAGAGGDRGSGWWRFCRSPAVVPGVCRSDGGGKSYGCVASTYAGWALSTVGMLGLAPTALGWARGPEWIDTVDCVEHDSRPAGGRPWTIQPGTTRIPRRRLGPCARALPALLNVGAAMANTKPVGAPTLVMPPEQADTIPEPPPRPGSWRRQAATASAM